MWVSAWVAVAWFATLFLYQYLRYHFSGHPLRQLFSPDDTQRFAPKLPGGQPVGFPPIDEETTTKHGRARCDWRISLRRLIRASVPDRCAGHPGDSQKTLNVIEKPAYLRGKQIAHRRLTQPWPWTNGVGTIPAQAEARSVAGTH